MSKREPYTVEEIENIRLLTRRGFTDKEIAKKTGRPTIMISNKKNEFLINPHTPESLEIEADRANAVFEYWRERGYEINTYHDIIGNVRSDMVNGMPKNMKRWNNDREI